MKRIVTLLIAMMAVSATVYAQTSEINKKLASNPDVNITYLNKSMLDRIPKDQRDSPLGILAGKAEVNWVKVYELGNAEAEKCGEEIMDSYLKFSPFAEILTLQQGPNKVNVIVYGLPVAGNLNEYKTVLMYMRQKGKFATLIVLSGRISDDTVGNLLDALSVIESAI